MTLWALHLTGTDDFIAAATPQAARQLKATCDRLDSEAGPLDTTFDAVIVEWPFSPEVHAEKLREAARDA